MIRALGVAVGLALLSPEVAAAERRYAVVIGVNEGLGPDLPLRYAESDAHRVADLLLSLGGVQPADLVLLQGADADDVRGVLDQLHARLSRELAADDRGAVFLYYSGHADGAALRMDGTELPLRELRDTALALPVDLRVVVLDACQVGEILRAKGGALAAPFPIAPVGASDVEGLAVITAAAEGEDAQESERLQGGVFTHHLLAGLTGAADTSGDQRVTLHEAFRYAHARTLATTSRAPVVQHPSYAFDLQGQTEVALTTLEGARRVGRLILTDPGLYVVFDAAETRLVAEVEVGAGAVLALPDGEYMIRRRQPDRVYEARVTVRAAEESRLSAASMLSRPFGQSARRGETSAPHAALAVIAGGGLSGPLREGLSVAPTATVGIRLDLPWFTLMARGRYDYAWAQNQYLELEQHQPGGEITVTRLVDVRRASLGFGVMGGASAVLQRFETEGDAPDRLSGVAHLGPLGRAEWAAAPRLTVGLELGLDVALLKEEEPQRERLGTTAVPRGGLDATFWLR